MCVLIHRQRVNGDWISFDISDHCEIVWKQSNLTSLMKHERMLSKCCGNFGRERVHFYSKIVFGNSSIRIWFLISSVLTFWPRSAFFCLRVSLCAELFFEFLAPFDLTFRYAFFWFDFVTRNSAQSESDVKKIWDEAWIQFCNSKRTINCFISVKNSL